MTLDRDLSPITGTKGRFLFSENVLGRHQADYFLDESIGYIFVAAPHWLNEAYSDAIAVTDTGVLARNNQNAQRVSLILNASGLPFSRGIDLGAGYGLFVRAMRDLGFDFYWTDKYSDNLVARGFEARADTFDVGVAFEVLEHLENPALFISDAIDAHDMHTVFFSACCFDTANLPDRSWWYWSFETGQHVSFFSNQALDAIGQDIGMKTYNFGGGLYAFSRHDLSSFTKGAPLISRLLSKFRFVAKRAPLTEQDHIEMRDRLRAAAKAS